jgi:hypothetical protein
MNLKMGAVFVEKLKLLILHPNMTRDVKINKWTRGTQDKLIIMCNSCYLGNVKVSYGDFTY